MLGNAWKLVLREEREADQGRLVDEEALMTHILNDKERAILAERRSQEKSAAEAEHRRVKGKFVPEREVGGSRIKASISFVSANIGMGSSYVPPPKPVKVVEEQLIEPDVGGKLIANSKYTCPTLTCVFCGNCFVTHPHHNMS